MAFAWLVCVRIVCVPDENRKLQLLNESLSLQDPFINGKSLSVGVKQAMLWHSTRSKGEVVAEIDGELARIKALAQELRRVGGTRRAWTCVAHFCRCQARW